MTLREFFEHNNKAAIAFSGGVDSAYLLYAAQKYGKDVTAYFVNGGFQPAFELEDAGKLAEQLGANMKILRVDVLQDPVVASNPPDRCYYCKQRIFTCIREAAAADGYQLICDGTNASDDAGDRPGMRALSEMKVCSPLRECGLTKDEIRRLSKEAGLFTWNKPSYACLATRIPAGTEITREMLQMTEASEEYLKALGFEDFRVRWLDGCARLQVPQGQMERVMIHREEILEKLKKHYRAVLLDLDPR